MSDTLYFVFLKCCLIGWASFVVGAVLVDRRTSRIDSYIGMGFILICPYLLTCFGIHSVQVADQIEVLAKSSGQQSTPAAWEPPVATLASFEISTAGGNHVRFDDGWRSDSGSGSVSFVRGRSRREMSSAGFAASGDSAAGRVSIQMQATDESAGSGSRWRSSGSDMPTNSDGQGNRVVWAINQPYRGTEEGLTDGR